jgi:predicted RNA-binding Zn-ribbon protein involved in translation (DUF1610 family)
MNDRWKEWASAGKTLAADPTAKVLCPECYQGFLVVEDRYPESSVDKFERCLQCPKCGKLNILLMTKRN